MVVEETGEGRTRSEFAARGHACDIPPIQRNNAQSSQMNSDADDPLKCTSTSRNKTNQTVMFDRKNLDCGAKKRSTFEISGTEPIIILEHVVDMADDEIDMICG